MRGVIQKHRLLILSDEPIVSVAEAFPLANETTKGNIARWHKDSASPTTRMILEINGSAIGQTRAKWLMLRLGDHAFGELVEKLDANILMFGQHRSKLMWRLGNNAPSKNP